MFENVLTYFKDDLPLEIANQAERTPLELQIASCVILVETALVDNSYKEEEFRTMVNLMLRQFKAVDNATAEKLVGLSEMVRQRSGKISNFIDIIARKFSLNDRKFVYGLVWKVIKSDGKVHEKEIKLSNELGPKLGLTTDQQIEARQALIAESA